MKNLTKGLRYSLYLLLVKCIFCVGLNAQEGCNLNIDWGVMDTLFIGAVDSSYIISIDLWDIFNEYEEGLGFEKRSIPCGCEPCAAYCYEEVPRQPSYEDFKKMATGLLIRQKIFSLTNK